MMSDDLLRVVRNVGRLAALHRSGLLDSPAESAFDRFTRLATRVLRAPTALISLVDHDRQFFKSAVGLGEPWASRRETPLSHSFCKHVVASGEAMVIGDARVVPTVRDSPAVGQMNVIAYAGMPLRSRDGHVLGTLCVVDEKPREWSRTDLDVLQDLAACVSDEIELRTLVRETEAARKDAEARLLTAEAQLETRKEDR
jgi:GAF domain-containing protein